MRSRSYARKSRNALYCVLHSEISDLDLRPAPSDMHDDKFVVAYILSGILDIPDPKTCILQDESSY